MTEIGPAAPRVREAVVFALILAAHLCLSNEYPNFPHPNTRSRLYLTLALAEEGRFEIDTQVARYGLVLDLARRGDHYYSDKPPGASLLLAPIAALLRVFIPVSPDPTSMLVALRIFGVSLPCVGFWYATRRFWYRAAGSAERGLALILAGALGTSFFVYATQLFNHAIAAVLLFASWRLCVREVDAEASGASPDTSRGFAPMLSAGFLGGLAFSVDQAIALGLAVLFAWAIAAERRRRLERALALAAGAALPALLLLAYNAHCFGSPFATGFQFVLDPRYADAYRSGLLGIHWPDPRALFGLTLGAKRGLFYLSPFLLLSFVGFRAGWRERSRASLAALLTALGIGCFASMTVDWESGWSVGSRYVVAAIPLLMAGAGAALARGDDRIDLAFRALACVGIAAIGLAAVTFPHFPKDYSHPLWQLALPLLRGGHLTRNLVGASGAAVLFPWAGIVGAAIACVAFGGFTRERAVEWRRGALALALGALVLAGMAWSAAPGGGPYLREATKGVLLRMGESGTD
jgi:hypothetical protein